MTPSTKSNPDENDEQAVPRAKFTLTDDVVDIIETHAESQYAGNKSAFIRDAVREKADRPNEKEIRIELGRLRELIEDELTNQDSHQQAPQPPNTEPGLERQPDHLPGANSASTEDADDQREPERVARELLPQLPKPDEDPISLTSLEAAVDEPLELVVSGISQLSQRDMVERVEQNGRIMIKRGEP